MTQPSDDPRSEEVSRGDRVSGRPWASRSPVVAQHGMAATAHPVATRVAVDVLRQGGNAVDAAIAANAALGFLEPVGCGIGGDLFALVWDPNSEEVVGLNASGRAPIGRSYGTLREKLDGAKRIPPFGSLSVTVPGAVSGWFALHERFGKRSMDELLQPAIELAREGSPLPQTIAYYWRRNIQALKRFAASEPWLEELDNALGTFAPGGRVPGVGEVFANPDLARTYERIASGGRAAFYQGVIAKTVDGYMRRIGGDLRLADFQRHTSEWVKPLSVLYRGVRVYELPPNTQGVAALQMLAILNGFDLGGMTPGSAELIHLQVEAKRLAFEDRARFYSDPAAKANIPDLLSDQRIVKMRELIRPNQVILNLPVDESVLEEGDTTYLTVADGSGMMVSLIQSNYRGMGSGLVPDGLGFMLQDRGELFALDPDHSNVYAPGKRPFHTIIPAMATRNGKAWLSFGVMGGAMQPQGHVQVLSHLVDFGMNVQEAGDAARWRHDGSPEPTGAPGDGVGVLYVESGISPTARDALRRKGHQVRDGAGGFGGYQAILRDDNAVYHGASEMRKDGLALGY
ncbi:MAG: gamma-glutamyltransferase family protein [Myxococcota bacterium]